MLSFILGTILWKKRYVKSKRDIEKDINKEGGKIRKTNEKLGDKNGKIKNKWTKIKTLRSPALWLCVVWQDCNGVSENRAASRSSVPNKVESTRSSKSC